MKSFILSLLVGILSSCAITPIPNEYTSVQNTKEQELGNGVIMIFNNAGWLQKIDNSDKINIWINGKMSGQYKAQSYRILKLPIGKNQFHLEHRDGWIFKSDKTIIINSSVRYLQIQPHFLGHLVRIIHKLPGNFTEFQKLQ